MPSLRTRIAYANITLDTAQDALAAAATEVAQATVALDGISLGTLDLDAVMVGGTRFINNGGVLEPEP